MWPRPWGGWRSSKGLTSTSACCPNRSRSKSFSKSSSPLRRLRCLRSGNAGENVAQVVAAAGFGQDGVDAAGQQAGVVDFGGVASDQDREGRGRHVGQLLGELGASHLAEAVVGQNRVERT